MQLLKELLAVGEKSPSRKLYSIIDDPDDDLEIVQFEINTMNPDDELLSIIKKFAFEDFSQDGLTIVGVSYENKNEMESALKDAGYVHVENWKGIKLDTSSPIRNVSYHNN